MSQVKTGVAGLQEGLVWELTGVEGGLEREGSLFIQLMTISWLSVAAFQKFLYQKARVFAWGWQGWSSESAVSQKPFHIKSGSLYSGLCTVGPGSTVHRLPPPPKAGAFQGCPREGIAKGFFRTRGTGYI